MKTFAAAAIAATSASAFDAMTVPEFVAGFMYGMTGDNNLAEIEACYQGGESIGTDVQTAFADYQSGNYFQALKDAGTAWTEVGTAMTTCQGMDADIASIEAWAQIFTNPTELASTVAKRWLFHGSQIKADIAQEETDWSAGSYFDAGNDTANALTLAVGPIKSNEVANINLKPEEEFISGLLWGLIKDNHLSEIQACVTDAGTIFSDVEKVVKDVGAGSWHSAAQDAKDIASMFPKMFNSEGDCSNMLKDVTAIEKWADRGWWMLIEDIVKDMLFHRKQIEADVKAIGADWNASEYYNSGAALADLLTVSLGPIETSDYITTVVFEESETKPSLDEPESEFLAGFLFGFVGDSHVDDIKTCENDAVELYYDIIEILGAIEWEIVMGGAWTEIANDVKKISLMLPKMFSTTGDCRNLQEDVQAIQKWADRSEVKLAEDVAKDMLFHKSEIESDAKDMQNNMDAKEYYNSGKAFADLMTDSLGPIEPTLTSFLQ